MPRGTLRTSVLFPCSVKGDLIPAKAKAANNVDKKNKGKAPWLVKVYPFY